MASQYDYFNDLTQDEKFSMNIQTYVQRYNHSMSKKKRKQLIRKVNKKLNNIQPRILEAKLLNLKDTNKTFRYEKRLRDTLALLNNQGPI